jgi:hypothetical protein
LGFAQSAGLEASARFAGRSATVTPGENANRTDVLLIGTSSPVSRPSHAAGGQPRSSREDLEGRIDGRIHIGRLWGLVRSTRLARAADATAAAEWTGSLDHA